MKSLSENQKEREDILAMYRYEILDTSPKCTFDRITALLAVLSHEIRTPLNGVMGMISLLQDTELSDEQKEYAEVIETSGHSLLALVKHISDYTKLSVGQMEMHIQPFDIRFCLEQVLQLFDTVICKKGIRLTCEIDPNIPMVLVGDDHKIRQILINLIGNSIKFTRDGEINISIDLNLTDTHSEYVNLFFNVKDTGIGIPTDQVHRLFHPFVQIHVKDLEKHNEGIGLGLSICKQLVELMDGHIWLEESNDKGASFSYEIKVLIP